MVFAGINWIAVLICVVFAMANGFVWYNPKTFFNTWWKVVGGGKEMPSGQNMGPVWAATIAAAAVKAIGMAIAVNVFADNLGGYSALNGLLTGLIVWAGVVAPTYLSNKLFAGHGVKVWLIEIGNHLVDFLAFGLLLGAWRI